MGCDHVLTAELLNLISLPYQPCLVTVMNEKTDLQESLSQWCEDMNIAIIYTLIPTHVWYISGLNDSNEDMNTPSYAMTDVW